MFVCFIVQIVFRYFFNFPIGWTSELSVITWLYIALLGSAFWPYSKSSAITSTMVTAAACNEKAAHTATMGISLFIRPPWAVRRPGVEPDIPTGRIVY